MNNEAWEAIKKDCPWRTQSSLSKKDICSATTKMCAKTSNCGLMYAIQLAYQGIYQLIEDMKK